jgi:hypothetical protein
MPSQAIIEAAAEKIFCQRVAFIAFQVATAITGEPPETPNHLERLFYCDFIYRGDEKALLLTLHVVASSSEICSVLSGDGGEGGQAMVTDEMLTTAIANIWDARALAYAAIHSQVKQVQDLTNTVGQALEVAHNMRIAIEHATTSPPPPPASE